MGGICLVGFGYFALGSPPRCVLLLVFLVFLVFLVLLVFLVFLLFLVFLAFLDTILFKYEN